jgi:hypothetical protein
MKQIKWVFLLIAIAATGCIMGIGIAIAERSIFGILACIIATMAVFGLGFSLKRKLLVGKK